jgi:hypothetical protein
MTDDVVTVPLAFGLAFSRLEAGMTMAAEDAVYVARVRDQAGETLYETCMHMAYMQARTTARTLAWIHQDAGLGAVEVINTVTGEIEALR